MPQDDKVKYLQMIQDVVKRMADTSAAVKRYALVSFAGAAGLARALNEPSAMLLAMILVFVFWALDAQYLRQEKWFRDMYDLARTQDPDAIDFNLHPLWRNRESGHRHPTNAFSVLKPHRRRRRPLDG